MSHQYHLGSGSPTKRRRGRPRKDESLPRAPFIIKTIQTEVERSVFQPQTDLGKGKSLLYEANTRGVNGEDQMIGQVVIGVLEGAFDAGYLLTMKVAESEIRLKGLVLQPGKFVPITPENDVAPLARMYSRTDLPSPVGSVNVRICESAKDKEAEKECVELEPTKQPDLGEPQLEEIIVEMPSESEGMKGDQIEGVEEKQPEQIIIVGLPNKAPTEYEFSIAKRGEAEESNAKEKLEILASLSVEMDFTKPLMEVCEGEKALRGQSHELAQRDPPMEPLAKKLKAEEAMHWKEAISAEEMKAATTLNELVILQSIKEHGKSLDGESKQAN